MVGSSSLTVVYHLHVVSGTALADPVSTRLTLDLRRSLLEDLLDGGPGGSRSTGHERRTVTSTLLTTRHTGTDEQQTSGLKLLGAADRGGVVRVTAINDDITGLEIGLELCNEIVDGRTSLDEQDNLAGPLQFSDELLNRVSALDFGTYGDYMSRLWICQKA